MYLTNLFVLCVLFNISIMFNVMSCTQAETPVLPDQALDQVGGGVMRHPVDCGKHPVQATRRRRFSLHGNVLTTSYYCDQMVLIVILSEDHIEL